MQTTLLEPIEDSESLELLPRADSASIFHSFEEKAKAAAESADKIKVTDITDTAGPKMARAARLSLREIRIATEKRRKEMVEGMTEETRRINGLAKQVKDFCEEREAVLLEAEQFVERETARIEDERRCTRSAELNPYLTGAVTVDLGKIEESAYQQILTDAKDVHAMRIERERKAEADRLAAIEAERVEQERIRAENARLKQEAEEREAAARAEREEAARRDAAAAEERRQAEAKARAEREAAEAKIREAERKERQARADAEAAEQRRKDEARKAKEEAERAESKRQAALAAAARKAAAAPDKEKLLAFAASIKALPVPMLSAGSSEIQQDLSRRLAGAVSWITNQANEL